MIGAFGAHALQLSERTEKIFDTAVQYQMYHTVALIGLLAVKSMLSDRVVRIAHGSWLVGIGLFSGSLYLLAITESKWLGLITPLGGLSFIIGWVVLIAGAMRCRGESDGQA